MRSGDLRLSRNGRREVAEGYLTLRHRLRAKGVAFSHPCIGGINILWEPA